MRVRFWAPIAVMLALTVLAIGLAGCSTGRVARANTPVPSKTLRPTFTSTIAKPTLTPSPTSEQSGTKPAQPAPAGQASAPTAELATATAAPTTAEPNPTPEAAAFTVTTASINVRGGPGTAFPVIGRLSQGQSFPITGKNRDGTWWEFDYNGKSGWVIGSNVTARGADAVLVAKNIPQPPTAAPRPTARPAAPRPAQPAQAAQPAQPAPAATKYAANGSGVRPDSNDWVTVYCIVYNQSLSDITGPGTLRVSKDGQVVGTASFTQFPTYYLDAGYNAGCKVEIRPAANGTYTAELVEGDQVVSEPIKFTVTGPENRITFVAWKQR